MTLTANDLFSAAERLHTYLLMKHWNGQALVGPDPGIRFNSRVGRFVKSYAKFLPWSDDLVYLQAQGYWILDNWLMFDLSGSGQYGDLARASSEYVLSIQRPGGYWNYPNPEWKGRIATVEGCFAALGLLESYARIKYEPFLIGAIQWYQYLIRDMGFRRQDRDGLLAVNYFAHHQGDGGGVPNNSTLALWFLARLAQLSGDDQYLELCGPMVAWLIDVQVESGELPYAVSSPTTKGRTHFLCFQYNAFEFMELVHYFKLTGDQAVLPMARRLAGYLATGLSESGAARYDCTHDLPEVTYYTSAVAQALSQATLLDLGDYSAPAEQAFARVLAQQEPNGGSSFYSRKNYRLLSDRRSYPRYLSMILNHLFETKTRIAPAQQVSPAAHSMEVSTP